MGRDDDEDDVLERRRRKREADRTRLILALAVGGGLALVCVLVVLVAVSVMAARKGGGPLAAVAGPSPDREGETFNHAEMIGHLNTRGLGLDSNGEYVFTRGGNVNGVRFQDCHSANLREYLGVGAPGLVLVRKMGTAQEAHDAAGLDPERKWSWGRFYFVGDPNLVARIRTALR